MISMYYFKCLCFLSLAFVHSSLGYNRSAEYSFKIDIVRMFEPTDYSTKHWYSNTVLHFFQRYASISNSTYNKLDVSFFPDPYTDCNSICFLFYPSTVFGYHHFMISTLASQTLLSHSLSDRSREFRELDFVFSPNWVFESMPSMSKVINLLCIAVLDARPVSAIDHASTVRAATPRWTDAFSMIQLCSSRASLRGMAAPVEDVG